MKILFAGTPDFAVPSLQALLDVGAEIPGVFTQPDRPAGRGRHLKQSPVKIFARKHELPLFQPNSLEEEAETIVELDPQLIVVVAYGNLLPEKILEIPLKGCVNVHASLLPRWRGAAPIQRAILAGDQESGITLMQMDKGLDTGEILAQVSVPILERETSGTLHDKLALEGGRVLKDSFQRLITGEINPVAQNSDQATYAPKLTKEESELDWTQSALELDHQLRGFNPWPTARTADGSTPLKLWEGEVSEQESGTLPGTVIESSKNGILVQCGRGSLNITLLQRPGGQPLPAMDFLHGYPLKAGRRLGCKE